MSDFPFSIPRNKSVTLPPYSFTKYEVAGELFTVLKGTPDDDDPDQFDGEISDLAVTIDIPNDSTDVMLSGKILGEWGGAPTPNSVTQDLSYTERESLMGSQLKLY